MALTKRGIGRPDYAQSIASAPVVQSTVPYKKSQTLGDMAELGRRLKGVISFDGRGDLIFHEGFEGGLGRYTASGTGSIGPFARANTGYFSISLSVGAAAARAFYTYLPFDIFENKKIGHEFFISPPGNVDSNIFVYILIIDRNRSFDWYAKFVCDGNAEDSYDVYLYENDAAEHLRISGVKLFGSSLLFHQIKLVVDHANMKYMRLIVNGVEYDISAYKGAVSTQSFADNRYTEPRIRVDNDSAIDYGWYIDDVIVTINEPDNE